MIAVIAGLVFLGLAVIALAGLAIAIRREERGVLANHDRRHVSLTDPPPTFIAGAARRLLGVYVNAPSLRTDTPADENEEVNR